MASLDLDKKKALGRGLASLIPDASGAGEREGAPALTPKKEFFLCDIEKIVPNTYQPRKIFTKEALDELIESVKSVGIIQPITVRQKNGSFEIIAGERRWRAAQRAGLKQVPVILKDIPDDLRSLQMALIENIQRSDLNCIEEAIAYQQLTDEFQLSQEQIATQVGKNRTTVANTMRLLKLPAIIREDITAGKITMGHARALLSLESSQDQMAVRELIIKKKLSVRDTERKVNEIVRAKGRPVIEGKPVDANLLALEDDLRREYGTPVKIFGNLNKGMIQLTYGTAEELMRITDKLKGIIAYTEQGELTEEYAADGTVLYQEGEAVAEPGSEGAIEYVAVEGEAIIEGQEYAVEQQAAITPEGEPVANEVASSEEQEVAEHVSPQV